ncbi:MAG: Type 1 glutamine amidotransferase-like domain-containing protein [Candidatus Limnocylindrales bacterium]|jgi:cyanophycinase
MKDTLRSIDTSGAGGRFLLLGSGEFEPWVGEAERFVLATASGDGSVAVLATASGREGRAVYDRWTAMGLSHYQSLGVTAHALHVETRVDALVAGSADVLDVASMVFFSGGSPGYLAQALSGTPVWDGVKRLLARGGVFAGCSAGAMIAGAAAAPSGAKPLQFPFGSGLGLLPTTALGVHWDAMSGWRIRWLRDLAPGRLAPGLRFIGLPEHTAIASDGGDWRVFGAGRVDVRTRQGRYTFGSGETFPRTERPSPVAPARPR